VRAAAAGQQQLLTQTLCAERAPRAAMALRLAAARRATNGDAACLAAHHCHAPSQRAASLAAQPQQAHAPPQQPHAPLRAPRQRRRRALHAAHAHASASSASSKGDAAAAAPDYRCWTNPGGAVLTELVPGAVWAAECVVRTRAHLLMTARSSLSLVRASSHSPLPPRPARHATARRAFVWNGIDVGGRSVVLRLRDGGLWVHSPVALDAPLAAALAALGPVRHVVAPNYEHVKYARQWLDAYPDAVGYGCPGLRAAAPQLGMHADAVDVTRGGGGAAAVPHAAWGGEVDACWLDFERNPFTGKPFFNELLFFHVPSRTALTTDFWWNYPSGKGALPFGSAAWKLGMDAVYAPFYDRFMVVDRAAAAAAAARVAAWAPETLAPCHGRVLRGAAGRDALAARFAAAAR
jgi:hypothetical protein